MEIFNVVIRRWDCAQNSLLENRESHEMILIIFYFLVYIDSLDVHAQRTIAEERAPKRTFAQL